MQSFTFKKESLTKRKTQNIKLKKLPVILVVPIGIGIISILQSDIVYKIVDVYQVYILPGAVLHVITNQTPSLLINKIP